MPKQKIQTDHPDRDRKRTEAALLQAVQDILITQGSAALGINEVARQAGVSKVLIYRYFGSLQGLIDHWAKQATPLPPIPSVMNESQSPLKIIQDHYNCVIDRLAAEPQLRALMCWELSAKSDLNEQIAKHRESEGLALTHAIQEQTTPELDIEALGALISAGIYYLALRSDTADVFNGLPIGTEQGRIRLKATISRLAAMLFEQNK